MTFLTPDNESQPLVRGGQGSEDRDTREVAETIIAVVIGSVLAIAFWLAVLFVASTMMKFMG